MTAMFPVQSGVPIPDVVPRQKRPRRKFPVDTMTIGQFFFVPGRTVKHVCSYISRITKDLPGKFTTRRCWAWEDKRTGKWTLCEPSAVGALEGVGVWRTE